MFNKIVVLRIMQFLTDDVEIGKALFENEKLKPPPSIFAIIIHKLNICAWKA